MTNEGRLKLEMQIVRRYIRAVIDAGYSVSVENVDYPAEYDIENSTSVAAVMAAMRSGDEDRVICRKTGATTTFLFFVYGNEPGEVLNDYGVSLEPVIAPVNEYAEKFA